MTIPIAPRRVRECRMCGTEAEPTDRKCTGCGEVAWRTRLHCGACHRAMSRRGCDCAASRAFPPAPRPPAEPPPPEPRPLLREIAACALGGTVMGAVVWCALALVGNVSGWVVPRWPHAVWITPLVLAALAALGESDASKRGGTVAATAVLGLLIGLLAAATGWILGGLIAGAAIGAIADRRA